MFAFLIDMLLNVDVAGRFLAGVYVGHGDVEHLRQHERFQPADERSRARSVEAELVVEQQSVQSLPVAIGRSFYQQGAHVLRSARDERSPREHVAVFRALFS